MLPKNQISYEDILNVLGEPYEAYRWQAHGDEYFEALWVIDPNTLLLEIHFHHKTGMVQKMIWWKSNDFIDIEMKLENIIHELPPEWSNKILFNLDLFK